MHTQLHGRGDQPSGENRRKRPHARRVCTELAALAAAAWPHAENLYKDSQFDWSDFGAGLLDEARPAFPERCSVSSPFQCTRFARAGFRSRPCRPSSFAGMGPGDGVRLCGEKSFSPDVSSWKDALPMHRHRFHCHWNYTLHPQHSDTTGAAEDPRPAGSLPSQSRAGGLRSPELTGMTGRVLDALVDQLSRRLDELREHGRSRHRGGDRIRARGAGAKDKLTTADRVLATVLYLRKLGTRDLIAQLDVDSLRALRASSR
ncbi:hypothetical protein QFZ58_000165 [Streptomyces sp. B1I3]|nr:hypothetical protein [Streptomyces sp. B1I3]